ncbi:MAG TPA: RluA family pseudouridine synthase [Rhabdochlamydiaceae bacterium]|nr:RluA family pseudouridine synthase [Rhabdochlamydiaceae bacterium]
MKTFRLEVKPKDHGAGLLSFLRDKCKGQQISVKALKRAIDEKKCTVNGRVEYFSTHHLSSGDRIELKFSDEKKSLGALSTLFEDESLLICNKPAGLVCTANMNAHHLIHRLDKETSGVLIFAKTDSMKEKMVELFVKRRIQKHYLAIVDGWISEEGKMDDFLVPKTSYDGGVIYTLSKKKAGKRAITLWKCLKKGNHASLALIEPITGRTHQIRVQFHAISHPILGDWQYAKEFVCLYRPMRHLLHSYQVNFIHPITHEKVEVTAELPQDFLDAKNALDL